MPGRAQLNETITLIKRNIKGEATWQYKGRLLRRVPGGVLIEAFFNRPDMPFLDIVLKQGDRAVEVFYTDRWYNIFEIYDRDDGKLKGWYCNIGLPAVEEGNGRISYIDLALDLWVTPDGRKQILDEDEFSELPLDEATRVSALTALEELSSLFADGKMRLGNLA